MRHAFGGAAPLVLRLVSNDSPLSISDKDYLAPDVDSEVDDENDDDIDDKLDHPHTSSSRKRDLQSFLLGGRALDFDPVYVVQVAAHVAANSSNGMIE